MNQNNTFRVLWGAIVVLLLINIGTILWIWLLPGAGRHPADRLFLEKELGFDDQQIAAYRKLRASYFTDRRLESDSIKPMKEAFLKQVAHDSLSDEQLYKLSSAIEAKSIQNNILTFKHLRAVRALCTAEQKKKFDEIIDEIAFQMAKPPPPPPVRDQQEPPREGGPPPQ